MLDTIGGIPAHPLIIHAAVIFIPLLILGAVVFAVLPQVRGRIGWAVAVLAVIAPLSALFAKLSGQELRQHLIDTHASSQLISQINQHMSYGTATLWWSIGLGVAALVLVGYGWRAVPAGGSEPVALRLGGVILTVGLGVVTGYYIFRTGDTGAHIVWAGI